MIKPTRAYLNIKTGILHRDGKQGDSCRKSLVKRGNVQSFATVAEGRRNDRFKRDCKRCMA